MENQEEVSLSIDGQVFKVKKNMLIEHSDYFSAMFSGSYIEKEQEEIRIDVVDANSMNIILRYMELGLIDLSEYPLSTIGDLAFAANFLQIMELHKQIVYCLEQQLSKSNWMEILDIALHAPSKKLEHVVIMYGLFSFKYMKPDCVKTIQKLFWYLSHPFLYSESELHVFKFGLKWIESHNLGADTLLIILCCLDICKLTKDELKEMKDLVRDYVNSLTEKVIDCLHKLSTDYRLTLLSIKQNKQVLCELYTEKVYNEVLNLVKESIQRRLEFTPAVPMWSNNEKRPEKSQNHMFSFTVEYGFDQWIEIGETNLWGWNITTWSPTKIVMVCGEYGRGNGVFMRDVKVYDVHKKEWIQHGVDLPVRRHAGVVVLEDSLFILGGVGGFRVVLNSAIIYDLKQRTFRKIAALPDPIQSPAVCVHENIVYVVGQKHIYRYEESGDNQSWTKVIDTDISPSYLVSCKGYIYVAQNYFPHLYRFRPGVDTALQQIATFYYPPVAIWSVGSRLIAVTYCGDVGIDMITVEEFQDVKPPDLKVNIIWSHPGWQYIVNPAGCCQVVMSPPPTTPEVSKFHQRYLTMYGTG